VRLPVRKRLCAALISLLAAASACATFGNGDAEPDYAKDAETNLSRGKEALENRNYLEAAKYFEYVRTRYPYKDVATEAELLLADSHFEREEFIEARDAYQNFLKAHPTWPRVDYAAFRSALTYYKEIPSDLFIIPPSFEKDQAPVKNALRAMQDFLRQYPKSALVEEAKRIVDDTRKRMARHEMYVASFYEHRERWRAVAARLEVVASEYKGLGFDEEALFGLYDAYTRLGEKEKATRALEEIVARMPGTKAAEKARSLLGKS
jgi:outer membrane protein assembly factor BamD